MAIGDGLVKPAMCLVEVKVTVGCFFELLLYA